MFWWIFLNPIFFRACPSNTYNWPDVGSILVNAGPTKSAKGQYRANCMCYLGDGFHVILFLVVFLSADLVKVVALAAAADCLQ